MKLEFALRDEKVNIFSMIYGIEKLDIDQQIMLCKKSPIPENRIGPFILDSKLSFAIYELSDIGRTYINDIENKKHPLKYVAFVDTQIRVKITDNLFERLCKDRYFSTWNPEAPVKYFSGSNDGYIVLFRVYELNECIDESLLEKGRKGRNFYYGLTKSVDIDIKEPVIRNDEYKKIKKDLIELIDKENCLMEIIETNFEEKFNINHIDTENEKGGESYMVTKDVVSNIHNYIQNQGYFYTHSDISNIYLSLKTKPFVILAGISGTGKSKLVKLLAESMGAKERFTLIPVRPDWSDSSELIGYKDLNGTFHPGILTTTIEEALRNKNYPYFVCLDEMNLARVEYYLSDILSIIESREMDDNGIIKTDKLIREELLGNDTETINKYSNIYIPENLYIIGTVNMDETTFPFSKKVLDRANTIEFNEVNLGFDFDSFEQSQVDPNEYNNSFLKSKYIKLIDCREEKELATDIINKLIDINNILERYNQHFGYRVRDEIVYYCLYSINDELFTLDEAMDYCIVQKILPKIGGSDEDTLELLVDLYNYLNNTEVNTSDIEDHIRKADIDNSKYKLSTKKISVMIRRFVRDGFTNFWQ